MSTAIKHTSKELDVVLKATLYGPENEYQPMWLYSQIASGETPKGTTFSLNRNEAGGNIFLRVKDKDGKEITLSFSAHAFVDAALNVFKKETGVDV